jgi:hypothetical protein
MRTQAATLTHLDAALEAANTLAHHAALALEEEQQGQTLQPIAYRKRVRAIQDLVWCAVNDLGHAKRLALVTRRKEKDWKRRCSEHMLKTSLDNVREYFSRYPANQPGAAA